MKTDSEMWSKEVTERMLRAAYQHYWSAATVDQERAAYYEILLRGGVDGYAPDCTSPWRLGLARWLRRLAIKIEHR